MLRLFRINAGLIQEIECPTDQIFTCLPEADWIDAHKPDEQERSMLAQMLHTDLPESDEMEEIEASARCFVDQAGIHVHNLFLTQADGRHNTVSVACILQKERLITIRDDDVADFRLLRLRARRGQVAARSPQNLLVTLFEQKMENQADTLEDLHRQLEGVSYLVLAILSRTRSSRYFRLRLWFSCHQPWWRACTA
ncbi:CorA family divalent cation transporter [Haliea sp. E1-2-M8]|uniref:CorA family divalent cation transporter n=1 Tax=Haliea sp. E1-2-M8 TaxID=3064706 RepID=UPI00271EFA17|nr:CorA family divalent cation transporter [Haliea sp. E1-2-M8]MDO8863465.1 CorA family divalent cation transporter [Haliea sp. E1-2-M8]